MNLATASSSSSQRKIVLFMWLRQGGLDFQEKRKERNTQFFVVANLELNRTILHHFVTIFVREDQKR